MAQDAGRVGSGNEGQNDMDRGSTKTFTYSDSQRNTGKVGGGSDGPNPINVPDLSKKVSDRRLS